jgi:uncharacterized heparinase superfamily protein
VLAIEGYSSSRLGKPGFSGPRGMLTDLAEVVHARTEVTPEGTSLLAGHRGYARTHGLTHMRGLSLASDGRMLLGEDTLGALTEAERRRFEEVMRLTRDDGVRYALHFHLHPDVDAALDMGGTAVSLALKSGEIWVFRHDGYAELRLEPSVYLEKGRLKPRSSRQIVLSASVVEYASQISWTLAKAQDTPLAIRDLDREEPHDEGSPPDPH